MGASCSSMQEKTKNTGGTIKRQASNMGASIKKNTKKAGASMKKGGLALKRKLSSGKKPLDDIEQPLKDGDALKDQAGLPDIQNPMDLIMKDSESLKKGLMGTVKTSGLDKQLEALQMTPDQIEEAVGHASRYIVPGEGADIEKVQVEVTENPTVQEFVGKVNKILENQEKIPKAPSPGEEKPQSIRDQAAGQAEDAAEQAEDAANYAAEEVSRAVDEAEAIEPASPDMVKKFLDSLKGMICQPADEKPNAANDKLSAESSDYSELIKKYFGGDMSSMLKDQMGGIQEQVAGIVAQ